MANKIAVVGSCMIDLVSYAPRLPKAGETIHGHKFAVNFGGKGANQCVAAAKLGAATTLVARLGDDTWGLKYLEELKKSNVNTEYLNLTENTSSGMAQIIVSDEGENQIVIVAGANQHLCVNDINNARNAISSASVLIVQLETSVDVAIQAMEICNGISILNGAPALALGSYDEKLLKLPTIFAVNENEAAVFTGLSVTDTEEAITAAKYLIKEKGCQKVLITLGEKGAILVSAISQDNNEQQSFSIHQVQSPTVACVDSTGAGDAFIGALAYFLAEKKLTFEDAIRKACILAADSVTRLGTQTSFAGVEILEKIRT